METNSKDWGLPICEEGDEGPFLLNQTDFNNLSRMAMAAGFNVVISHRLNEGITHLGVTGHGSLSLQAIMVTKDGPIEATGDLKGKELELSELISDWSYRNPTKARFVKFVTGCGAKTDSKEEYYLSLLHKHGICTDCGELFTHQYDAPFASCACKTSEWYEYTPHMVVVDKLRERVVKALNPSK